MRYAEDKPRRSYFEVPIMDDHKWSKVPGIAADVFLADMEDSVPPDLKPQAREKVVDLVRDPSYLAGREYICRPNNLASPWGRDDAEALARVAPRRVLYPKARDAREVKEFGDIFARCSHLPEIVLLIETAEAVVRLPELARCAGVTGLAFGAGDLSYETGVANVRGSERFPQGFLYARGRLVMVARAFGLEAVDAVFPPDPKDLDDYRRAVEDSRLMGFTGMLSFYPPQVDVINEVMTPSESDLHHARRLVEGYEQARGRGLAAVTIDGQQITIHEYRAARDLLSRVQALVQ